MIDLNKPEPKKKRCDMCLREIEKPSLKKLIHWPNVNFKKEYYTNIAGEKIEGFSYWCYLCQWCKGVETKKKKDIEIDITIRTKFNTKRLRTVTLKPEGHEVVYLWKDGLSIQMKRYKEIKSLL